MVASTAPPKNPIRMLQRLANYEVQLRVPEGVDERTLTRLCNVLDLIDLRSRIESCVRLAINTNLILSKYVFVEVEE